MRTPERSEIGQGTTMRIIARRVAVVLFAYLWALGLIFGPAAGGHHRFGPDLVAYCPGLPDATPSDHGIPGSLPGTADDGTCCIASVQATPILPPVEPFAALEPVDARSASWSPVPDGPPAGFPAAAFASPRAPPVPA